MAISHVPVDPPAAPAPAPAPEPSPLPAPSGSSAVTVTELIAGDLLGYLSDGVRTSVLSAANTGSATARRLSVALEAVDALADLSAYQIDAAPINGLANGSTSAAISASVGVAPRVRVVILLGSMQPAAGGTVVLAGAGASYSLALPTTAGPQRLEFVDLPAALAASFTVQNGSGVAFPSSSNSIVVLPV